MERLLTDAASQRQRLTTLIGTVRIQSDPLLAAEAWRHWVDGRPPGSVSALTRQEAVRSWTRWTSCRDDHGEERLGPGKTSRLGLHAVVAGMIEAERILGVVNLERAGTAVHLDRNCLRLVGSLVDPDDFPVWPADSYDLLVDSEFGILLRFEASSGSSPIARVEFTEVSFGPVIEEDAFEMSAPRGAA